MKDIIKNIKDLGKYDKVFITNYKASSGQVSNVLIDTGTTYEKAKECDHELFKELQTKITVETVRGSVKQVEGKSDEDVQTLINKALVDIDKTFTNPRKVNSSVILESVSDGIASTEDCDKLYISGFVIEIINKNEIKEKSKNTQLLTHVKNNIRSTFKTNKFTKYAPKNIKSVSINEGVLKIECDDEDKP